MKHGDLCKNDLVSTLKKVDQKLIDSKKIKNNFLKFEEQNSFSSELLNAVKQDLNVTIPKCIELSFGMVLLMKCILIQL